MTKLLPVLLAREAELKAGFEHAIRIAMHEATMRSTKPRPEEPDVVAMLVLEGVPYIANTLRFVTKTHGICSTVSSVFCHQRPLVEFNRNQDQCELGDILIVHRHTSVDGDIHNNALLLQAKMFSGGGYEIPIAERHQLRLYKSWPRFEYVRSGPRLNGKVRDIRPKARHNGAQYLLIDDGGLGKASSGLLGIPGTHCMAVWPAKPVLYPNYSLADELVRFLVGVTGRPFVDRESDDPTGWSTVVWDLLEHSISFVFNRKNVGISTGSRFGGDPMTSSLSGCNFCTIGDGAPGVGRSVQQQQQATMARFKGMRRRQDREPTNDNVFYEEFDDMGGVSVILIETQSSKG